MNETQILETLTERAYDYAAKTILGKKAQVLTAFVLLKEDPFSKENMTEIIGTPWKNDEEKKEAILAIGMTIIRSKEPVQAYSMVTECWTSSYKADEKKRASRPEFDPQRRECVMCVVSTGTRRKFSSWTIQRDAKGNCAELIPNKEPGTFESWMTSALDKAMELADFTNTLKRNQHNN
jgi:hypothetical protein